MTDTLTPPIGCVGATMVTRCGLYFDFLNPKPEQIDPTDIGWGLSNCCRFNGHTTLFYSVAQHSVLVSGIVPPEEAFAALLHDAAEAYTGDMVKPLKQLLPDFQTVERRVEAAVAARFGVPVQMSEAIKTADLILLRTEQRDLTAGAGRNWNGLDAYAPLEARIEPLDPVDAFQLWMARFHDLAAGVWP